MNEEVSAQQAGEEGPLARLCYVDDSRTAAFVMRRLLEPYGYQVDYFQSAEPAFVALVEGGYDLLLTDLKVSSSGMDGDDLIRSLRQSGRSRLSRLPIIVITGTSDPEILVRVYAVGANQVMTKPVDGDALDGHIRQLLRQGREATRQTESPRDTSPASEAGSPVREVPVLAPTTPIAASEVPSSPEPDEAAAAPFDVSECIAAEPASPLSTGTASAVGESAGSEPPSVEAEAVAVDEVATDDGAAAEQVEEYEGEVEIIIDPERPARRGGRTRRPEHDLLYEMDQYALDGTLPRSPGPLARWFSRRRLLWLVFIVVLGLGGVEGWQYFFDKGMPVQTLPVATGEIFQSVVAPGQVVSRQQVEVSSARDGRLVGVLAEEGDTVAGGQLLARLDDRELGGHLKRVRTDLANARADIRLAERTLQRLRQAQEKGAVARRFVEDAEVRLRAAQARAGAAAEAVQNARLELERLKITAPFAGIITRRNAEKGQWVTPATPLFVLADPSQREIEVRVHAADSVNITEGQVVLVTSDAFPGQEWQERVIRIGSATEKVRNSDAVKVYVSLGEEAPPLRFGQQVDAEIRTAWNPNAIKVPFEALLNRDGRTFVAVLQDGRVHLRPVITGIEDFAMAEIRQGLNGDEELILPRGRLLHEGDKVYRPQDGA